MLKLFFIIISCFAVTSYAADWTTWRGNISRSGVSSGKIPFPLKLTWNYSSLQKPVPAVATPHWLAKKGGRGPEKFPNLTADRAYPIIIVSNNLYFSSSTEENVSCLDAQTGKKKWTAFCEGAVRFAPVYYDGKLFFGSDDGFVYCVDANSGTNIWSFFAGKNDRKIILNNHIASQWPVRTGLAIKDSVVYAACGIFPAIDRGVMLFALNANNGNLIYKNDILIHAQGYLLIENNNIIVPAGRAAPLAFNLLNGERKSAKFLSRRDSGGGSPIMINNMVVYGPNENGMLMIRVDKEIDKNDKSIIRSPEFRLNGITAYMKGLSILVNNGKAYVVTEDEIQAYPSNPLTNILLESAKFILDNRANPKTKKVHLGRHQMSKELPSFTEKKNRMLLWKHKNDKKFISIICSENALIAGGENFIAAFDLITGKPLWSNSINGTAWELAIANDKIYVSTDEGEIYCFSNKKVEKSKGRKIENLTVSDSIKKYAETALKSADTKKGFAVVLGVGDGSLAYEIAENSDFKVVCLERDKAKIKKVRNRLLNTGLYGNRISIHHIKNKNLNFLNYFANLIVTADDKIDFLTSDIKKILQPNGGAFILPEKHAKKMNLKWNDNNNFKTFIKGKLDGEGEWTHMFANNENTLNSNDEIVKGNDFDIQWIGDGGSEGQFGWHYNSMTVLSKDGKMFLTKADYIEAVDQYNGTFLWRAEAPDSLRLDVGDESGQACVDSDFVYVACKNDCRLFDVNSGKNVKTYFTPNKEKDWGFIAIEKNILVGSCQNPNATLSIENMQNNSRSKKNKNVFSRQIWGDKKNTQVVSENLFALDKKSGSNVWLYNSNSYILNPSITFGNETIYFLECRNQNLPNAKNPGYVYLKDFFNNDSFLVALDINTGEKNWETPYSSEGIEVFYLSYVSNSLLTVSTSEKEYSESTSSKNCAVPKPVFYQLQLINANNGKIIWSKTISGGKASYKHNVNVQPAVILGDKIYLSMRTGNRLFIFELKTGEHIEKPNFRGGKGCCVMTGSASNLFYRNMVSETYNTINDTCSRTSDISRPACWLSNIPAGGLLLMPESSTGCDCAFAMQVSIVLAPKQGGAK